MKRVENQINELKREIEELEVLEQKETTIVEELRKQMFLRCIVICVLAFSIGVFVGHIL